MRTVSSSTPTPPPSSTTFQALLSGLVAHPAAPPLSPLFPPVRPSPPATLPSPPFPLRPLPLLLPSPPQLAARRLPQLPPQVLAAATSPRSLPLTPSLHGSRVRPLALPARPVATPALSSRYFTPHLRLWYLKALRDRHDMITCFLREDLLLIVVSLDTNHTSLLCV